MTREDMLGLAGFRQVGEGKNAVGRGLLFGFPSEAAAQKNGLVFVCGVDAKPDAKQYKAIKQRLKEDARTKGRISVTPTVPGDEADTGGNFFVVTVTFGKDDPRLWYEQTMDALETILREEGMIAPIGCAICGGDGGDALAHYDGRPALVHMSCLRQWKDAQQEALELKKQNSGHLRGVLGGLLGGVVGAVPALLALSFLDFYVGWLFALIPMGIYFGWKLFGGKLSRVTTIFTILYTLALALVVEVIDSWLILRGLFPYDQVTLLGTIEAYLDPALFAEWFLAPTLMALLFSAIGIFFAWRMISRTDQHELADLQVILDEAVPIESVKR